MRLKYILSLQIDPIEPKFCTCHDNTTDVTDTNSWSDFIIML